MSRCCLLVLSTPTHDARPSDRLHIYTTCVFFFIPQGGARFCGDAVAGDVIFECNDGDGCPNLDISIWYRITLSPNDPDRKQTQCST